MPAIDALPGTTDRPARSTGSPSTPSRRGGHAASSFFDLVGPDLVRHRHRAGTFCAFGAGVPVLERLRAEPRVERGLVAPAGHDEPLVAAIDRAQQLEAFEAVLVVDGTGPGGEAAGELVTGAFGDGDGVDHDRGHGPDSTRPRRSAWNAIVSTDSSIERLSERVPWPTSRSRRSRIGSSADDAHW